MSGMAATLSPHTHRRLRMNRLKKQVGLVVLISMAIVMAGTCCVSALDTVNINTATVDQLMALERVGETYAQRIVEHRETYGPFKTPEAIMEVKGIGMKTWEANKDRIVI
jgi:competence protein ComEA